MKRIAILQSNYLPWKGVFDLINSVNVFVFLEDVQYTRRDWRNRNKILTADGSKWITVPVKKGHREQLIKDVKIDNNQKWQIKHYKSFKINYSKTPYFKEYKWVLDKLYKENTWEHLSTLNIFSTKLICNILGIETEIINSTELNTEGYKDDKLIKICRKVEANYYLSGPSAKDYINPEKFKKNNIILDYINYEYPEYGQAFKPSDHHVTILDLIFNCGPKASYYIWGWREE